MNSQIFLIGLNYKTAPVAVREAFALTSPEVLANKAFQLDDTIQEYLILSTCNRVEVLFVSPDPLAIETVYSQWAITVGRDTVELKKNSYVYTDEEAITHLFSVASSLDSMVLGEPQILGQLKDAYRNALQEKTAKVVISRLLHKAFSVAKRVRTETGIASSAVSISYAAIELTKRIFDDMTATRALLIGAGEMAELAAAYLMNTGVRSLTVVNRTFERAEELASRFKAQAMPFEQLFDILTETDIVISSTAATSPIITAADMKTVLKRRKNRPMFFIDIAVPRDIAPDVNTLDNIYLYDIDDLKDVVEENLATRRQEAEKANTIIHQDAAVFCKWKNGLKLQPTIIDIIQRSNAIVDIEYEKTRKKLSDLSDEQHEAITSMLAAIVKKMNHAPIVFLKNDFKENDTARQSLTFLRRLFDLDNDEATCKRCPGKLRNSDKNHR